MNSEVFVANLDELPEGSHKVVNVAGKEIGIFNVRGSFYAVPNACFHQNGPLCRGAVSGTVRASQETSWKPEWVEDGEIIVCPWHSLEFNVTSGRCIAYPDKKLPTYRLRTENGQIFFQVGKDPA
jgi:nitrite reductase/ring-hydroxylating ferredoxin subunit